MNDHLVRNVLIISVVLIGIAISIGFSFAYFSARIVGNEDAKPMSVLAGTIELTFTDNNTISLPNAKPGDKQYKTFSVQNTGTLDDEYNYNIKLVVIKNTFKEKDLKYILEECNDDDCATPKENGLKESGYITTDSIKDGEMYIAVNIPRPANKEFQYYKLTIEFQELNINQSYNKEAEFNGKINVDAEKGAQIYKVANPPELYQGLIPVKYGSNGEVIVADPSTDDWYNYDEHRWANAVLVTDAKYKELTENNKIKKESIGTQLKLTTDNTSEILQMYVWIPRYKYQLFNIEGSYDSKEHKINVVFEEGTSSTGTIECSYENKNNGEIEERCLNYDGSPAENGDWYTHPAFTFKGTTDETGTELTGIWVGKFEPSGEYDNSTKKITNLKILPDSLPLTKSINFAYMFKGTRDIDELYFSQYNLNKEEIDTHVAKNIEWGAASYLAISSYGRYKSNGEEINSGATIWDNNALSYITGCSSSYVDEKGVEICEEQNKWNHDGIHASTTDNIYGIYDMSGGSYEFVMGNMVNENGDFNPSGAKFSDTSDETYVQNPESKYYDLYSYGTTSWANGRRHLGDATEEVVGWFPHNDGFVTSSDTWMARSAPADYSPRAGFLSFFHRPGAWSETTFRVVLTQQD